MWSVFLRERGGEMLSGALNLVDVCESWWLLPEGTELPGWGTDLRADSEKLGQVQWCLCGTADLGSAAMTHLRDPSVCSEHMQRLGSWKHTAGSLNAVEGTEAFPGPRCLPACLLFLRDVHEAVIWPLDTTSPLARLNGLTDSFDFGTVEPPIRWDSLCLPGCFRLGRI